MRSETYLYLSLARMTSLLRLAAPDFVIPSMLLNSCHHLHRGLASNSCRSYQVWEGVYESPTPIIPSHEPVGTIVALGEQAKKSGKWKVGQRVGVLLFRHACHHCIGCRTTNDVRFCKNKDMAGLANDGGMAEYIIGDADNSVLIPDNVPFEQAAPLMCAGVSDRHLLNLCSWNKSLHT